MIFIQYKSDTKRPQLSGLLRRLVSLHLFYALKGNIISKGAISIFNKVDITGKTTYCKSVLLALLMVYISNLLFCR